MFISDFYKNYFDLHYIRVLLMIEISINFYFFLFLGTKYVLCSGENPNSIQERSVMDAIRVYRARRYCTSYDGSRTQTYSVSCLPSLEIQQPPRRNGPPSITSCLVFGYLAMVFCSHEAHHTVAITFRKIIYFGNFGKQIFTSGQVT